MTLPKRPTNLDFWIELFEKGSQVPIEDSKTADTLRELVRYVISLEERVADLELQLEE